jgi:hypothetical protein
VGENDVDYEQMSSYEEAKRPRPGLRRTPHGHWLEADRVVDPLLLEWFDVNLEKMVEQFGSSPVDRVRPSPAPRAA